VSRPSVDRAEQDRLKSLNVEDPSLYLNVELGVHLNIVATLKVIMVLRVVCAWHQGSMAEFTRAS
jgi:hypothetical protein